MTARSDFRGGKALGADHALLMSSCCGATNQKCSGEGPFRLRMGPKYLEEALADANDVAGLDPCALIGGKSDFLRAAVTPDINLAVVGAKAEASGERDRVEYSHVVHIRIFAGLVDLSDYVEWPVVGDLDADARILEVVAALKCVSNLSLELAYGQAHRLDLADQGHLHRAGTVDDEFAAEIALPIDVDFDLVARAQLVGQVNGASGLARSRRQRAE